MTSHHRLWGSQNPFRDHLFVTFILAGKIFKMIVNPPNIKQAANKLVENMLVLADR